jgi:hypothetical protein
VEIIATCRDGKDVFGALRASGFSPPQARILVDILPEAFAVHILEELGASSVFLDASAKNAAGDWVKIPLEPHPIYAAAISLAKEHRSHVAIAHEAYRAIAGSSSLVGIASKALDSGSDLMGATISLALIGARAEDFDE